MHGMQTSSGSKHQIETIPLEDGDYKLLHKTRYFFDWKTEKGYEVYKLRIAGANDILGLISLERIPEEWRVHIRLLTVSIENKGAGKQYERIAGNMIAHAAKIAVREYAEHACVSLKPKSQIAQHYIDRYQMRITGITLSIEVPEILELIKSYDHEE
jgi:hypothetical protein